jgi:hypothetical protein
MKLVRFGDWRTGLLVQLPNGPHVIDVVASVGVLLPEDPISHGLLNGMLKDGGSWAPLIQHWERVRPGLRRLAQLASSYPDHPRLIMLPVAGIHPASRSADQRRIAALEIAELDELAFDPTGRESMMRQVAEPAGDRLAEKRVVALERGRLA